MWAANLKPRWDLHYILPLSNTPAATYGGHIAGRLNKDVLPHD